MPYAYSSMNLNSGSAPAAKCGLSSVSSNSVEWVEIVEPQTNQHMYVNLISGQYSWETPPDASVKRTHENQWWELFDSKMGRYYYYNAASMKTTWQRPVGDEIDIIPLAKLQTLKENTESAEHARVSVNVRNSNIAGDSKGCWVDRKPSLGCLTFFSFH
ncbi:unnamed protein product [Heligmosomoides polygyrus]|uniref:WW domain-containing protein n=1 Tax=Heligmosomoides polygyrus TaxID=6339 RepID=A0A183FT04_HELPZ|nr:unnamed protein product [Heligmosomoides polygyrus]